MTTTPMHLRPGTTPSWRRHVVPSRPVVRHVGARPHVGDGTVTPSDDAMLEALRERAARALSRDVADLLAGRLPATLALDLLGEAAPSADEVGHDDVDFVVPVDCC